MIWQPPTIELAYLCHPVAPTADDMERERAWLLDQAGAWSPEMTTEVLRSMAAQRAIRRNVQNAHAWLRALVLSTDMAIIAPWLPYIQALDDGNPEHRARGMRDSQAAAAHCTVAILVGGRISSGMREDAERVLRVGGDLIALQYLERPPTDLAQRVRDARLKGPPEVQIAYLNQRAEDRQ
jgi:hypothetical protein